MQDEKNEARASRPVGGWRSGLEGLEVGGNEVRRGDAARRKGIKYSVDPPVQELISRNPLQNSPVL